MRPSHSIISCPVPCYTSMCLYWSPLSSNNTKTAITPESHGKRPPRSNGTSRRSGGSCPNSSGERAQVPRIADNTCRDAPSPLDGLAKELHSLRQIFSDSRPGLVAYSEVLTGLGETLPRAEAKPLDGLRGGPRMEHDASFSFCRALCTRGFIQSIQSTHQLVRESFSRA